MIDLALGYIVGDLDAHLRRRFQLQGTIATLNGILDEDGAIPEANRNRVIVSLVNLDVETNHPYSVSGTANGGQFVRTNLPFQFNMDVMVSSMFADYKEGLKLLSASLVFFQSRQVFNHQNSPGLSPRIDKLTLETLKVDYSEMHNIWQALGAKYLPSVLLKFRMISLQGDQVQEVNPNIQSVDQQVNPRGN